MEKIEMTYEEAVKRIENIVSQLESGLLPMQEAIKLFEEGQTLVKQCFSALDTAKGKLTTIKEELGKLVEETD